MTEATAPAITPFDHAERRIRSDKAEAYADTCARLCAHLVPALLDTAEVGPGTRVLDVGCGTGTVSAAAVARGASVYAADADPGMVAATRRAVPGITPHIARLPELPDADDPFDAGAGNFVLNHVGRPLAPQDDFPRTKEGLAALLGARTTTCAPDSARGTACWRYRIVRCWRLGPRRRTAGDQRWRFI
ncbi:class I SAM-dependent methyltransferase [Streptomyces parvus]|uniref:class I SAM-dependent methyltransferase n=1 Tax=Streptomyces parvus TaxID=66428 RepID=UPI0033CED5EB